MWELFITIKQENYITSRFPPQNCFKLFSHQLPGRLASPTRRLHSQQPVSHPQGLSQALRHRKPHISPAELSILTRVAVHYRRSSQDPSSLILAQGLGSALVAKITPDNAYSTTGYCIQHPRTHKTICLFVCLYRFFFGPPELSAMTLLSIKELSDSLAVLSAVSQITF